MEGSLLYLRPRSPAASEPVIDDYTRTMTATFRASQESGVRWRGFHICPCGATSSNTDYILPGTEIQTNSLCVHYLAYHRGEVDEETLLFVAGLSDGEAEPTRDELGPPTR